MSRRRVTRTFQCDPGLWISFTRKCKDEGVSASNTIERLVDAWLGERVIILKEPGKEEEQS